MRICFIINKLLVLGDWAYKLYNIYVAAVTICLESISVIVINIYNPIGNKEVIIIEKSMELTLNKIKKEIILFRDFNAYYSVWGNRAAVIKTQSKYLLKEMERRILYLLTL